LAILPKITVIRQRLLLERLSPPQFRQMTRKVVVKLSMTSADYLIEKTRNIPSIYTLESL
jgi:hypothetical protein